jgi:hypothetical protein
LRLQIAQFAAERVNLDDRMVASLQSRQVIIAGWIKGTEFQPMNEDKKAAKGNPLRRRLNPLECSMLFGIGCRRWGRKRRAACSAVDLGICDRFSERRLRTCLGLRTPVCDKCLHYLQVPVGEVCEPI